MERVYLLLRLYPGGYDETISAHRTRKGAIAACDEISPGVTWARDEDRLFGTSKEGAAYYRIKGYTLNA